MPTSNRCGARPLARVASLLALACIATGALASDPPAGPAALAQAAPAAGTPAEPAAATATLPPAVTSGGDPSQPAAPQGLGIGVPGHSELIGVPLRMVLEVGSYRCDLNRSVTVRQIATDRRSMTISWLGKDHSLSAVDARSGALRFENPTAGLVWLVIVGKSMLLDSRKGQQLANDCRL